MRLALLPFVLVTAYASHVTLAQKDGRWTLLVDGKPFFVKGAVAPSRFAELAAAGGNSVRTSPRNLDAAHAAGLTALVNLPLGNPRQGFDYANSEAVQKQRDRIKTLVLQYKDHPETLLWAIGNEPEIRTTVEQRVPVWKEIDAIARLIKSLDSAHPVIAVIGGQYKTVLHEAQELCPSLDAMGLNSYKDMLTMPEDVAREGWTRPYLVTEFGPVGHWQVPKTPWKIPIEDTSTEKAAFYEKAYRLAVLAPPNCLGSYVFYWAFKQEKTHTWYGMWLEDGSRTNPMDVMTLLWTGRPPANRCPTTGRINLSSAEKGRLQARIEASDPDQDPLTFTWEVRQDVADNPNVGGDFEPPTPVIPGCVMKSAGPAALIALPPEPGNYRIFVEVRDGRGNAAVANIPVQRPAAKPESVIWDRHPE
jgi:hypothetical protein